MITFDAQIYRGYRIEHGAHRETDIFSRGEHITTVESLEGAKALIDHWVDEAR